MMIEIEETHTALLIEKLREENKLLNLTVLALAKETVVAEDKALALAKKLDATTYKLLELMG